jgi:hypothetical protein
VLDTGVQLRVTNRNGNREFPRAFAKQTETLVQRGEPAHTDLDPRSHGTTVASKALGRLHGVAKNANLISIKFLLSSSDYIEAFTTAYLDMEENNRFGNSVLVSSVSDSIPWDGDRTLFVAQDFQEWIDAFRDKGVPLVFAAGNMRNGNYRRNIDLLPMVLQNHQTPIR